MSAVDSKLLPFTASLALGKSRKSRGPDPVTQRAGGLGAAFPVDGHCLHRTSEAVRTRLLGVLPEGPKREGLRGINSIVSFTVTDF